MKPQDYTITLYVTQTPEHVFKAINDIRGWWSEDFNGQSEKCDDEFEVRFADMHTSKQKLIDVLPNQRIVWLVTQSHLSFLENKSEWTGHEIRFEISSVDGKTAIHFTHIGLVPASECYKDCYNGWNYFLQHSLYNLITTGKGQPHKNEDTEVKTKV